ncbi:MAG: hypothetical protein ACKOWW_07165 [Flavobacteriales bacterium]
MYVFFYFYLDRKPFSDDSLQLLLKCEQKQVRAFITPVIVANTYYILRRYATHHYVIERLQEISTPGIYAPRISGNLAIALLCQFQMGI